jgi:hypothetical protein
MIKRHALEDVSSFSMDVNIPYVVEECYWLIERRCLWWFYHTH